MKARSWIGMGMGVLTLAGGATVMALQALPEKSPITEYSVVKGDTLFEIAGAHGVTVAELKRWNGLSSDLIEIDQILEIRPGSETTPDTPSRREKRTRITAPSVSAADKTSGAPALVMPPEKLCLAGPGMADLASEEGMLGSAGLSYEAISASMGDFVHNTLVCIGGADEMPADTLQMEITVACTGRVANIAIVDRGDWSEDIAACVVDTLMFAEFPAHDLPDGEIFAYPLRFTPPS